MSHFFFTATSLTLAEMSHQRLGTREILGCPSKSSTATLNIVIITKICSLSSFQAYSSVCVLHFYFERYTLRHLIK